VKGSRFFRDHHSLSLKEWHQCIREAGKAEASFVLTTEKDAIKIPHTWNLPLFVAHQTTSIAEADEFEAILKSVAGQAKVSTHPLSD